MLKENAYHFPIFFCSVHSTYWELGPFFIHVAFSTLFLIFIYIKGFVKQTIYNAHVYIVYRREICLKVHAHNFCLKLKYLFRIPRRHSYKRELLAAIKHNSRRGLRINTINELVVSCAHVRWSGGRRTALNIVFCVRGLSDLFYIFICKYISLDHAIY